MFGEDRSRQAAGAKRTVLLQECSGWIYGRTTIATSNVLYIYSNLSLLYALPFPVMQIVPSLRPPGARAEKTPPTRGVKNEGDGVAEHCFADISCLLPLLSCAALAAARFFTSSRCSRGASRSFKRTRQVSIYVEQWRRRCKPVHHPSATVSIRLSTSRREHSIQVEGLPLSPEKRLGSGHKDRSTRIKPY